MPKGKRSSQPAWWRRIPRVGWLVHASVFIAFAAIVIPIVESSLYNLYTRSSGQVYTRQSVSLWIAILVLHFFLPGIKQQLRLADQWQAHDTALERLRDMLGGGLAATYGWILATDFWDVLFHPALVLTTVAYGLFAVGIHVYQNQQTTAATQHDEMKPMHEATQRLHEDYASSRDRATNERDALHARHGMTR